MSKLLMNLRDVPDDEADDVRAMLDAQGIAFYKKVSGTISDSRWAGGMRVKRGSH